MTFHIRLIRISLRIMRDINGLSEQLSQTTFGKDDDSQRMKWETEHTIMRLFDLHSRIINKAAREGN